MIEIKLSELQDEYVTGGDCGRHLKFLCNTIRRIIRGRNYGISFDIDVTEQFRKEWYKKVLGKVAEDMPKYHGAFLETWNADTEFSYEKYVELFPEYDYDGTLDREYREWVLQQVMEKKGDVVFFFYGVEE
jgi:hypothetical protein